MPKGGVFDGDTFCVSGAFSISQNEMKELVIKNGAHIATTPNKNCTYLVADSMGSSKTMKAEKDGIAIVTEEWVQKSIKAGKKSTDASLFLSGAPGSSNGGSKKKSKKQDSEEEEEDDEEEEKPKKKAPAKKAAGGGSVFSGETFCVSGSFSISQAEMRKLIITNGGDVVDTPNKKCTFLVADSIGSSKTIKAQNDGIDIVTEAWVNDSIAKGKKSTDKNLFLSGGGVGVANTNTNMDDDEEEEDEDDKPKKKAGAKRKAKSDDDDAPTTPSKAILWIDPNNLANNKEHLDAVGMDRVESVGSLAEATTWLKNQQKTHPKILTQIKIVTNMARMEGGVFNPEVGIETTLQLAQMGVPYSNILIFTSQARATAKTFPPSIQIAHVVSDLHKFLGVGAYKTTAASTADAGGDDEEEEEDDPPKKAAKKSTTSGPSSASTGSSGGSSGGVLMKKVIVKGAAPVDDLCPKFASAHVYVEGSDVYDCMLNQTNIGNNNNKFYVIQLLESDASPKQYWVWNRWGRVGAGGQNSLTACNLASAKSQFESKFHDKTKNKWANRANFVSVAGKYTLLERDYSADDDDDDASPAAAAGGAGSNSNDGGNKSSSGVPSSKLDKRVQDLIKLICDLKMMKDAMLEVGYDANKLPLGKLSKDHIRKGYEVLQEIADELDGSKRKSKFVELSNKFYTLIPHVVGMKPPPIIQDVVILKQKIAMVESLADVSEATKLLRQSSTGPDSHLNPVDVHYEKLKCAFQPIDKNTEEFKMLTDYTKNTHGHTHNQYKLEVLEAFNLDREGELERFNNGGFNKTKNTQLLWHGSRLTNFVGIISQGLRIAPPEAPVTGYMFGKGVYFADMVSKSANYCNASRSNDTACMLLCEVALGDMNELLQADYHASNLPPGKLSTKGCGVNFPDPAKALTLPSGVIVPLGPEIQTAIPGSSLLYNEFIVYNTAQIKMKYLIKMKFKY